MNTASGYVVMVFLQLHLACSNPSTTHTHLCSDLVQNFEAVVGWDDHGRDPEYAGVRCSVHHLQPRGGKGSIRNTSSPTARLLCCVYISRNPVARNKCIQHVREKHRFPQSKSNYTADSDTVERLER